MAARQEHFRMLAAYNRWANERIYACAAQLSPAALAEQRGAFFGSLLGTLNHLLVADRIWMSRLEGTSPQGTRLDEILHEDLAGLQTARRAEDERIVAFVGSLAEAAFDAALAYATTSGVAYRQPLHQILAHLFNHQTHHRGQAHHLIGLALGRDRTPVLDLLAYQRSATVAAAA